MKRTLLIFGLSLCLITKLFAQNTFRAVIKDEESGEVLIGATAVVEGTSLGSVSDANGVLTIQNIPNGKYTLVFAYLGYISTDETYTFPLKDNKEITVYLEISEEMMQEVVVISSTRNSRLMKDIPTRIEVISGEELDEKAGMYPANISMLMKESSGIQVQQTSATSGSASIRIQGLDGKYTQLLKDGFPLYSGMSSGLSIMQIPPLDLKQVEVIKGSSSTLYGGGAIAGLINMISKTPEKKRELSFMVNGTSAKGLDLNMYYSQRFKKLGVVLYTTRNTQQAYDPNHDNFSDIPLTQRYTVNPKLFYYFNDSTTASLVFNTSTENRLGGDMNVIAGHTDSLHTYSQRNKSNRASTQFKFEKHLGNGRALVFKNSVNYFFRNITLPTYVFEGAQISSYSELAYSWRSKKMEWIVGGNTWTDHFTESKVANGLNRSYDLNTYGTFIQNTWNVAPKLTLESGFRLDAQPDYGVFPLPKISALYKFTDYLNCRLGGGLGYKSPTVFTSDAEEVSYQGVAPVNSKANFTERSYGVNYDINYKAILFEDITFSINQMFFYTQITNPLVLQKDSTSNTLYQFVNANGYVDTKGFETQIKLGFEHIKFFAGYTFVDTKRAYDNLNTVIPLTPKNKLNLTLMYEIEGKFRVGYEAAFMDRQLLNNGYYSQAYWTQGLMVEKKWDGFSVYVNFENYTDARQSRWQPMYSGTAQNPHFVTDFYAPTDGFITNAGFKLSL